MFQSFEDTTDPSVGAPRLARLRAELKRRGLDGFLVPRADEYQNEYVPANAERLRWLTGFTGSWGFVVVLADKAAVFVDGRYTLQAAAQVDSAAFDVVHSFETTPEQWIERHLPEGAVLGVDPWLHTPDQLGKLETAAAVAGGAIRLLDDNPLDAVWADRPAAPLGAVSIQPARLAGETAAEKLQRLRVALVEAGAGHQILTQPDGIAWMFNIRGKDVAHTPLPLAFAIVPAEGRPRLFIDGRKLGNESRDHIEAVATVEPPEAFRPAIAALGADGAAVLVDPASAAAAIGRAIEAAGGRIVARTDPTIVMKARKNAAELDGARAAHRRDGAALARFLAWFDHATAERDITEIDCAVALESFRADTGALEEVSFPSIVGAGPNGAIVHYRVSEATNRTLDRDSLFLIDSGGQYRDGTTDVTRTLAVGTPSDEMRARFTDVVRGMIAVSRAVFPKGTSGTHLDAFARQALWQGGFDYDHGTGHGVGSFLSVHEGPCRISKVASPPLEPGMILSNEPGYYRTGAFGIRVENLIVVREPEIPAGGDRPMMRFETLTLVPIDRRCLALERLTADERLWIDDYHARVLREIGPLVAGETGVWLDAACGPL
jgi:Xaa-Pro aminopeptidase